MASAATTAAAEWEAEARKVLVARKPAFGLPTACPTCLPALLYLRMAKVPFDIHVDTSFPDADHIPYVEFGECVAFNNEKGGVIEYLKEGKIVDLTSNLPSDSYPDLLSTKAMVSTWLADALQYELWVVTDRSVAQDIYFSDLSWPIGKILHWKKTRDVKQLLGITKLNAAEREDEIYRKANAAYDALSMRLGDQAFLFGNSPSDVDALFLGHVLFVLNALPGTSTLRSYLQNYDNLVNFAERMKVQLLAVDSSSGGSGSSAPSSSSMPRKGTSSGQNELLDPRRRREKPIALQALLVGCSEITKSNNILTYLVTRLEAHFVQASTRISSGTNDLLQNPRRRQEQPTTLQALLVGCNAITKLTNLLTSTTRLKPPL